MVLASHIIFTAYGFWLPNDPRGSWSTFVGAWELLLAGGRATKTDVRHSVAQVSHDRKKRIATKQSLRNEPVSFNEAQLASVAQGFAVAIDEAKYVVHACSILSGHVHAVVERHEKFAEDIIGHLKSRATKQLNLDGLHPFLVTHGRQQSPWTERGWKVFLDSRSDIECAIAYVERNPVKEGKGKQTWPFVIPYPSACR